MIITASQYETIHKILSQMLIGIGDVPNVIFLYDGNRELGISREEGQFLREVMRQEGLITNADGPNKNHLSELTATGYSIARSPGGYRAYKQRQADQQAQQQARQQKLEHEQLTLNRQSTAATVSGARSAKVSGWIAFFSLVATVIATVIAYRATADSSEVNARLQKLETQVQQLKRSQVIPAP